MKGSRALWLAIAALVLLAGPLVGTQASEHGGEEVVVARIEGTISQATVIHVEKALAIAEDRNVPLLLVLNTPGGLVDSTLKIDLILADSEVPVLTFVGPRSGFAASAGVFLHMMGSPNGMAPGTTIGSAQPVQVGPDGQSQAAGDKIENFLVGRIQEIADRTDRNATIAAQFITENRNMNRTEAFELGFSDVNADDERAFLDGVSGRTVVVQGTNWTLDTQDARRIVVERGFIAEMVDLLSNPQVAFLLVLAGSYALIFGLANPGSFVPETLGAILLVLGFIGIGLLNTSTAGVILLVLAVLFFLAEAFTQTNGFFSVVGAICAILSVILLVDEPLLPESLLRQFYFLGITVAVTIAALTVFVARFAVRTRKAAAFEAVVGAKGTVLERLAPDGRIAFQGGIWSASAENDEPIEEGTEVEVVGRDGLHLTVRARPPHRAPDTQPPA